ncbi:TPA: hypothetical protein HA251_08690 [Candidatus Woesearchaeota archaeon]|nr:hypothetical protein [Candidatus Woesearchaeota archaeon]
MKLAYLFVILLLGIVVLGCAQQQSYETPKNVDSAAPVGGKAGPDLAGEKPGDEPDATPNPAVTKLLTRNSQVKSYSFDVALLPDKRGGAHYDVKGTLIRVTPLSDQSAETGADVIFIDTVARTADGYCVRGKTKCLDPNAPIAMDYDEWIVPLPPSYLEDITYGEVIGSLTFFNKPVTRIKYQRGALYYEAYLDNYFGYPQRVAIGSNPEMTDIIGGYEYRNMAFNTVQDDQLTHVDVKL